MGRAYGTAVRRNRLRRRVRAVLRELSLTPGLYLIGAVPTAAELSPEELRATIEELLRRAMRTAPPPAPTSNPVSRSTPAPPSIQPRVVK